MKFSHPAFCAGVAFFLLLPFTLMLATAAEKDTRGPKLLFASGVIRSTSETPKVEPVVNEMVLSSGDKIKFMIELKKRCFVYLLHKTAQGEIRMLFPYSLGQFDVDYQTGRKYFLPRGDAWYQLDSSAGREIFYLFASEQRLLDIEYLYEKYTSGTDKDFASQLLAGIDSIRKQSLAYSRSVGVLAKNGAIQRGFERATGADLTDISTLAREIEFSNIYSETIEIEHR